MKRLRRIAVALVEERKLSHGDVVPPAGGPPGDAGGEGWDEDWDEREFFLRNRLEISEWAKTSSFARKIRVLTYERLYGKNPKVSLNFRGGRYEGRVKVRVLWQEPWDSVEDEAAAILRQSDLWKSLRIQPNQVWKLTDNPYLVELIIKICFGVDQKRPKTDLGSLERPPAGKRAFFEASSWLKKNDSRIQDRIWTRLRKAGVDPRVTELHAHDWSKIDQVFVNSSPAPDALMGWVDLFYFWETPMEKRR